MPDLRDKVALVTGASQGVGKGIGLALGEAGATVYITGRNKELLEKTADEISARGGRGIGLQCDHTEDEQVQKAIQPVRNLHILVNNVWGGYEIHPKGLSMDPFWKLGTEDWDAMFQRGLRAHFVTSRYAVPKMLANAPGLVVNTIAWLGGEYLRHLYYDVVKSAIVRMSWGMAQELKPYGITAVALAPGFVRTERVMAAHAAHPFDLSATESAEYIGRAVSHLAADGEVMRFSGQALTAGDLARVYGFTDTDGRQPPPFRSPC